LVAGGAEGGEKRLILHHKWKQGSSRRRERSSLRVSRGLPGDFSTGFRSWIARRYSGAD